MAMRELSLSEMNSQEMEHLSMRDRVSGAICEIRIKKLKEVFCTANAIPAKVVTDIKTMGERLSVKELM